MTVLHVSPLGSPDGPPLLAVHGITGHGLRFRRCADQGWPERRTVAVDLRGHGHSTSDGPWSIEQHVTDLIDTLDALDIESTDVVGHSYGGQIALYLLSQVPQRIRRLVLLDPVWSRPGAAAAPAAAEAVNFAGWASPEEARSERAAMVSPSGAWGVDEDIATHLMVDDSGRYRFRFFPPAIARGWGELSRALPPIPIPRPTLLVAADRAGFVTPDRIRELRTALGPDLDVVNIDCGHMLYWEEFDLTTNAVASFLAD